MHGGRIGSAELAELVTRRAQRHLRLEPAALDRFKGVLVQPESGARHRGAGKAPPLEGQGGNGPATGLDADLEFQPGAEGHPQIRLHIRGSLQLVCQRCLEALDWPVNLDVALTAVTSEEQVQALADPFDSVVMPAEGLLLDELVEDEVLASLPLAPVHALGSGPGPCGIGKPTGASDSETHRPFADLRARMERGAGDGPDSGR